MTFLTTPLGTPLLIMLNDRVKHTDHYVLINVSSS